MSRLLAAAGLAVGLAACAYVDRTETRPTPSATVVTPAPATAATVITPAPAPVAGTAVLVR
ncbi:MAG: hypothetical protein K2X11_19565 [Acetobacteraceae bacterium]|nr:hypothetical protein [Acetobacteraceae bacterium]